MFSKLIPGIFCAAAFFTAAAIPATAADDIESKVQMCSGCHGQDGTPLTPATPIIWGQQPAWLYKELHDYHSGDRTNAIMQPMVQSFSLADLRQAANYFAGKSWPAKAAATPAVANASATAPEGTSVCRSCHGQNFEGGAPAPRLAGLNYDYLIAQMNAFAGGQRTNNLDMPVLMKGLSDSQRQTIAHYLAAL